MPFAATFRHVRMTLLEWMIIRAVPALNRFRPRAEWQHSLDDLRHFPAQSWGASLADFLDTRRFADFLTNYEAHDAFHTLLNYDTNVVGELRLQAFMVGNRSASFAGRVLFVLGSLLLPELWPQLRHDFARGRQSECVGQWYVPSLLEQAIEPLRARIANRVDLVPFS
jgi:ubiquinone biosynthesis protein Coq4